MVSLHDIRRKIEAGDLDDAKRDLVKILRADPGNIKAWAFLALVLDDPAKQVDCYRRILEIDPDNREAAARLKRLTHGDSSSSETRESPRAQTKKALRCPQCGAPMEIRFIGDLQDKWAVCPYCGTHVDLPDSYQRIEREHTEEKRPWGSRRVDREVVQSRSDNSGDELWLSEVRNALSNQVKPPSRRYRRRRVVRVEKLLGGGLSGFLRGLLDFEVNRKVGELAPEDVVELAGGALSPEERRACPECGATISKQARRCDWCGAWLSDEPELGA